MREKINRILLILFISGLSVLLTLTIRYRSKYKETSRQLQVSHLAQRKKKPTPNAEHISTPQDTVRQCFSSTFVSINRQSPREANLDIRGEDVHFLDRVLAKIFPDGLQAATNQEKCLRILRFTASHQRRKENSGNATKLIKDGYCICGGSSNVFQGLLRRAGVPTRNASLFGLRRHGGHSVVEAWYDNQWHLFDPFFGVFYSREATWTVGGSIPSLHELRVQPQLGTLMRVVKDPWQGNFDQEKSTGVISAETGYLKEYYGKSLSVLYREYLETAFPVGPGETFIAFHPLVVDLTNNDTFHLGAINHDYLDVVTATSTPEPAGFYRIGGSTQNVLQSVVFKTTTSQMIDLIYTLHSPDSKVELDFVPMMHVVMIDREIKGRTVRFRLRLQDSLSLGLVYCPRGGAYIDAVEARRVKSIHE